MSRPQWYRLDADRKPVPLPEGQIFNRRDGEWIVAKTEIGAVKVSTVFLGLDHAYGDEPPVLFETLVFGGAHDQEQVRYSTWAAAEAGHATWVRRVELAQACAFVDVVEPQAMETTTP